MVNYRTQASLSEEIKLDSALRGFSATADLLIRYYTVQTRVEIKQYLSLKE